MAGTVVGAARHSDGAHGAAAAGSSGGGIGGGAAEGGVNDADFPTWFEERSPPELGCSLQLLKCRVTAALCAIGSG